MFTTVFWLMVFSTAGQQTQPDEEAVHAIAARIAETMAAGDASFMDELFDPDALLDRAMEGIEATAEQERNFRAGYKSTGSKLGSKIQQGLAEGGSFRLQRVYSSGGSQHAIFRLLTEGGVNYLDVEFAKGADGSFRIVDMLFYLTGEAWSLTVRLTYATTAVAADQGFIAKLRGAEQEHVRNLEGLATLQQQVGAGEDRLALATYDALPASFRALKLVQLLRLEAALSLPEAEYLKIMREYEQSFPGDPSLDLISVDALFLREDWDNLATTLNRLERRVGGDAWIDFLRGSASMEQGLDDEARRSFRAAIHREPTLEDPYWALLEISLEKRRFEETADLLVEIEGALEIDMSEVETAEEYARFRGSAEYRKWKAARRE